MNSSVKSSSIAVQSARPDLTDEERRKIADQLMIPVGEIGTVVMAAVLCVLVLGASLGGWAAGRITDTTHAAQAHSRSASGMLHRPGGSGSAAARTTTAPPAG
jgi:hypothetical protein